MLIVRFQLRLVCFDIREREKFCRIFFATDVRTSQVVFGKFIAAAKFYDYARFQRFP
jgi:hypothetical protein